MKLSFRLFLEQERYDAISANIPLPQDIYDLANLFNKYGASLYAVGGAVRDYVYSIFHGGKFNPKDVDLATEADPKRIIEILSTPEAQKLGIKVFPKGESFGVISAVIGKKEYEIATFRSEWYDPETGDGRRPDRVEFSTPGKDAQRRDLTINALFYDIHNKEIRDYNLDSHGKGQGIEDLKNLSVRTVGRAKDRFREDKLRVLRLIRFFSKYNPNEILKHLDEDTIKAIEEFKQLKGVSPERIAAEFQSGLKSSQNPINYILNYHLTGLLPVVLPNLNIDVKNVNHINNKNIKAVFAWLLKNNAPDKVRQVLNASKYSNDVADTVSFLIKLYHFNPQDILKYLKYRDAKPEIKQDVLDFADISGLEKELRYFLNYKQATKSSNFMHLTGKDIGQAMSNAEADNYIKNL